MPPPATLLIVDDEPSIRELFALVLRCAGYEVAVAATGEEGLEMVRRVRPALVLLDVVLPEMGGVEVCREIKADPLLQDVFVVLISGQAISPSEKADGLVGGADEYLTKPIESCELCARIHTCLRLRNATAELRAGEVRLRMALEAADMVTWEWDIPTGAFRYSANFPAVVRGEDYAVFGSLSGMLQQIHPEDRQRVAQALDRVVTGDGRFESEYRVRMLDGTYRWFRAQGRAKEAEGGQRLGALGVSQDITTYKQSEERLLRVQKALDATGVAVGLATADGVHFYQNEAFTRLFGYTTEELSQPTGPLGVYADPAAARSVFAAISAGVPWHGEVDMVSKDGRHVPIALQADAVKDAAGRIIGLVGLHTDISERRRVEMQTVAFSQLSHRLSGAITRADTAQIILATAAELMGGDAGFVQFFDAGSDVPTPLIAFETVAGQRRYLRPESPDSAPSDLRRLVANGAKLINRAPGAIVTEEVRHFGDKNPLFTSLMFVPVRSQTEIVGVLSLQACAPAVFSGTELQLLQTLADRCGDALHRITLADAMRKAQLRYLNIFQNATEGIFQSSPEGLLLEANPAMAHMVGYATSAELITAIQNIQQLYVRPEQRKVLQRMLEVQGSVRDFEVELRHRDGSTKWGSVNAHVVRDAQGAILYYEGTYQDITARRQAAIALADSRQLNEKMLASLHSAVFVLDAKATTILECNPAVTHIFGYHREDLVGKSILPLHPNPEMFAQFQSRVQTSAQEPEGPPGFELDLCRKDGSLFPTEHKLTPIRNEQGKVMNWVCVVRDITKARRFEAELRAISQRIIEAQEGERLRVARELHDGVNQILAAVKLHLRRLGEGAANLSVLNRETIARSADLITAALEENRRIAHNLRPGDLDALGFTAACRSLIQQFQLRTQLAVRFRLIPLKRRLPPKVELNLFRIIQEALANVEHHAAAKTVSVNLGVEKRGLRLVVRDDGCGFTPPSTASAQAKRIGIGLASIQERAASLDGTCHIKSAPGRGTVITIRLPLGAQE